MRRRLRPSARDVRNGPPSVTAPPEARVSMGRQGVNAGRRPEPRHRARQAVDQGTPEWAASTAPDRAHQHTLVGRGRRAVLVLRFLLAGQAVAESFYTASRSWTAR